MMKTAELFKLAILDGRVAELENLSYSQFGRLLSDWMDKSSNPDVAEEIEFGVDSEDGPETEQAGRDSRVGDADTPDGESGP